MSTLSVDSTQVSPTRQEQLRISALTNFEIASWEFLRATPANCPLRLCGAAIRHSPQLRPPSADVGSADEGSYLDDFHPWSRPVKSIDEFWSHSWSDSSWLKVGVLLLEYNGWIASVVGTLAAFVASALFAGRVLPGMVLKRGRIDSQEVWYGCWSLWSGVLFFVITLLCWRSRRTVFLDKLCISQSNDAKKLAGVLGIGAFLKSSHCLLVLVDSTYVTRLWCIFEIAAYSKLMEKDPDKTLYFLPLGFWTSFIIVFGVLTLYLTLDNLGDSNTAAVALVLGITLLSHSMRNHHTSLARLSGQLGEFKMGDAKCYCCTVGHVHPDTGARLSCDRDVVNACVESWFGSSEAFNAFVQHSMFDKFARRVGRKRMPFELGALACLPVLWGWMDKIAGRLRDGLWSEALLYAYSMVANFFFVTPLWFACFSVVTFTARRRPSSRTADIAVSLAVTLVGIVAERVTNFLFDRIAVALGHLVFLAVCCVILTLACLVYGGRVRCRISGARGTG